MPSLPFSQNLSSERIAFIGEFMEEAQSEFAHGGGGV